MKFTAIVLALAAFLAFAVPPVEGQTAQDLLGASAYIPQWADGGREGGGIPWSGTFVFTSYGKPTTVRVMFFLSTGLAPASLSVQVITVSQDGKRSTENHEVLNGVLEFPLIGQATVKTLGHSATIQSGWAEVRGLGEQVTTRLAHRYPFGDIEQETTVLPAALRRAHTIPSVDYLKVGFLEESTGIAFANPNPSPTFVDVWLVDEAKNVLGQRRISLPANGHLAKFVHEGELFGDFFANRPEFHGYLRLVSEYPIAVTSLGFKWFRDGRYLMDNSPALPGEFLSIPEQQAAAERGELWKVSSVQPVCFYPSNVTPDQNCPAGFASLIKESYGWWEEIETVMNQDNRSVVQWLDAVITTGQHTREHYVALGAQGYTDVTAEVMRQFPAKMLVIAHHLEQVGYGGGGVTLVPGPNDRCFSSGCIGSTWADFVNLPRFLRTTNPVTTSDPKTWRYEVVVGNLGAATHEFGHSMKGMMYHTDRLDRSRPDYKGILSSGGYPTQVNCGVARRRFPDIASRLMAICPNPINTAVDREDVKVMVNQ